MEYPTLAEVESASHEQVCRWQRFLPSPGTSALGSGNFRKVCDQEAAVMDRIIARVKAFGGFTPEISKRLGWKP